MEWLRLIEEGFLKEAEAHREKERKALGTFRAGSTGVITEDGKQVGKCLRLSYLRSQGIEIEEVSWDRKIMFAGGVGNEDIWKKWLLHHFAEEAIKCEEEIPIHWKTALGYDVTGRPDMVVFDSNGRPLAGLEHKMVSSLWTAKAVGMPEMEPKFDHLAQGGHYKWKLGEQYQMDLPYDVAYTSYVEYAVGPIYGKWMPPFGAPGSDRMKYREQKKGMVPASTLPFIQLYEINFSGPGGNGPLVWKPRQGSTSQGWTSTKYITKDNITRYYDRLSEMSEAPEKIVLTSKDVPLTPDASGNKAGYSICDYCPLKELCCGNQTKDLTLDEWTDRILLREETKVISSPQNTSQKGKA